MNKIELSIKQIVNSALVNLAEKYAGRRAYLEALFAVADFFDVKKIALKKASAILKSDAKKIVADAINDSDDADDIIRAVFRNVDDSKKAGEFFKAVCLEIVSGIDKSSLIFQSGASCAELENIGEFFDLQATDKRIIALFYAWDEIGEFECLCNEVCRNSSQAKINSFIAGALACPESEIAPAIRRLREKSIVEASRGVFPRLVSEISEYISEFDGSSVAEKFSKVLKFDKCFGLSTFPVAAADTEIILKLLKSGKPQHILLYGEPGAGKSEFAKALAKKLRKPLFIPSRESNTAKLNHTSITAAIFAAYRSSSIALIDEADEFLETAHAGGFFPGFALHGNNERKGAVNLLMDGVKGSVIWITNSIAGIDKSTRRRFTYSLRFDGISDAQKEIVIKNSLAKNGISGRFAGRMKGVSKRYGLTTAGIGLVLDKAADISSGNAELASNIEKIAKAHYELLSNRKSACDEFKTDARFDESVLNIDFPVGSILQTLESYREAELGGEEIPMSFLFSGAAGTGKTQLGRFIAGRLGKELLVKRMSEISSCYVGETEKNIRRMFAEAARDGAVLMIDEADSLFYDRQNASHSWEVSQTNEILAQMEMFKGVFICTTNLADNMDAAAMRRFNWKVKFLPPTHEGRIKLYSKYFLGGRKPAKIVEAELYSLEGLCPGDFYAVWQKTRFVRERPVSLVISALKSELSYKKDAAKTPKKIGFC